MRSKLWWCCLALLGTLLSAPAWAQAGLYESSLVVITTYQQRPDFDAPWKKGAVRTEQHIGTLVEGSQILVSALAVGYATHIEMTRFYDAQKVSVEVAFVDYTVGIALLKPVNPADLSTMKALPLGQDLRIGDLAELVTNHEMERSLVVPMRLSDISIDSSPTSSYPLSFYRFESPAKNGFGKSEPLVKGGVLFGIAVRHQDGVVSVLPASIIRHVLNDQLGRGYRGFSRLGVSVAKLDSPAARDWLKASGIGQGVLVTQVFEASPFWGKVERSDILLTIAGTTISKSGYYQHPLWGPTHFIDRVSSFYAGDAIKLTIVRDGKLKTVEGVLRRHEPDSDYVPKYRFNREPHLVFGGLLFQELSTGFLSAWGTSWLKLAPLHMVYLAVFKDGPRKDPQEKVVLLNRVLADDHNRGYESLKQLILDKVNGYPIRSMSSLSEALKSPTIKDGVALARISFKENQVEIVLAYDKLAEAHARIAKGYSVPLPSFFQYQAK